MRHARSALAAAFLYGLAALPLAGGCGGGAPSEPDATTKQNFDDELKAMENARQQQPSRKGQRGV